MIKVVTGIRRCGKSYLLFKIFKKHLIESGIKENQIIEVVLDDFLFDELLDRKKLYKYIISKITTDEQYYVLLDEVQLVDGFESLLNTLLRIKNIDCYVTGSNSKFLSSDIIAEFRGRGDEIRVHPLSYREFYSAFQGDKSKAYEEFSLYGGMPAILNMNTHEEKSSYLKNLVDNVYLSDIVDRHHLKNDTRILSELLNIISSSIGSLTNPSKLVNTYDSIAHMKVNRITISNYLDYFIDSFFDK